MSLRNPSKNLCAWLFLGLLLHQPLKSVFAAGAVEAWVQRYNVAAQVETRAVKAAADPDGNVVVAGYSVTGRNGADIVIIKYSGEGVPLWTNRYDGPGHSSDYVQCLAVDTSANIYLGGYSTSSSGSECITLAYSAAGIPLWTNRYSGPATNDMAVSMACDSAGHIYVLATSRINGTN